MAAPKLIGDALSENQKSVALVIGTLLMGIDIMRDAGFKASEFYIDERWIKVLQNPKTIAVISVALLMWGHSRTRKNFGLVARATWRWFGWLRRREGTHADRPLGISSTGEVQGRSDLSLPGADDAQHAS